MSSMHLHQPHIPYPSMDHTLRGRHSHMPPPPPPLRGDSGLYRMSELPSPGTSFHLSGMENSMQSGRPRGGLGDTGTGLKDLNNYLPVHKITFSREYPRKLFTVENSLTRETIVVLTCTQTVMFFVLKIKGEETIKPSEKFEFVKFHELCISPNDLEGFAISQNCSITLAPLKFTYALSSRDGNIVYLYDQGDSNNSITPELRLDNLSESESAANCIFRFHHDYPVSNLALDAEKGYLACIQELGTVTVWEIRAQVKIAEFNIPHQGIYISFHRSEPFQLMVIDASGWARFFNVFRQSCYRSIHLVQQNVFSAEWSLSNSNIFAAGFSESFAVIDTSKLLTSLNKCYEVPEQIINAVKISPGDDKVFATLSRGTGTIQLWRDNFATYIWKHRNANLNDIAWVHGYPYLLAVGHQSLYIYDIGMS